VFGGVFRARAKEVETRAGAAAGVAAAPARLRVPGKDRGRAVSRQATASSTAGTAVRAGACRRTVAPAVAQITATSGSSAYSSAT